MKKAIASGALQGDLPTILRSGICGYFISHPHLDHVAGLVLNAPNDSNKMIYALPFCLDVLRDHYFTWEAWANFGDEGEKPQLKKYHYERMDSLVEKYIPEAGLAVTAFPLSHASPGMSTAFLLSAQGNYLLYLGDTGPDSIEKSTRLDRLWKTIAPIIKEKKLKGIFIEVSYPNAQPDKQLFGHLTPHWLMHEMHVLTGYCGKTSIDGLKIFVIHIKPAPGSVTTIEQELHSANDLKLNFHFPAQAKTIVLE